MYSRYYTLKPKAVRLRKTGKTYGEIRKILGKSVAKSTLSHWLRDLVLTEIQQRKLEGRVASKIARAQIKGWAASKKKRQQYIKLLVTRNRYLLPLTKKRDVAKIALAMLYLGEGAKWQSHPGLHLGSSDPEIIKIYIKLLKKCYGISGEILRARISYRADQDLSKLTAFWSRMTKIPRHHFYKTKPDPRTIGKKTMKENYRGVCQITCAGTEIQLQLDIIARMFL